MQEKKSLILSAPVGTRSGYGSHSRDIALSLINSGKYDVKIIPTAWGATPNDALYEDDPSHKQIIDCFLTYGQKVAQPDIFIQVTIPNEFLPNPQMRGKLNIGITAGIETTVCRHDWLAGCNAMDLVIVSSEHASTVFKETQYNIPADPKTGASGGKLACMTPIEVLFEGVDIDVFKKTKDLNVTVVDELQQIEEDFCFLFVGHWLQGSLGNDRKDVGMLVKTFCDTFRMKQKKNQPALILKTSGASFSQVDKDQITKKLQSILAPYEGRHPSIYVIHGDLTDEEMNSLYNHPKVKSMVSFTKGEGFGRPLLEFTTTGKPVIASNWSGQVDFLDPKHAVLLPGNLNKVHKSAVNDWIVEQSQWFTVDYGVASAVLNDVKKNYDKHLKNSENHISITNRKFSLERMGDKLVDIIERYWDRAGSSVKIPQMRSIDASKPKLPSLPKLTKLT